MSDYPQVSFTLVNTSELSIEAQVYLEDINGIRLAFDNKVIQNDDMGSHLYKYEIGATAEGKYGTGYDPETLEGEKPYIAPGETFNFEYDFSNATAVDYLFNPDSEYSCNNLPSYLCNNGTDGDCFDYTKVTAVYITIINHDNGEYANSENCYTKEEFDGTVVISKMEVYGHLYDDYYGPYNFSYYEECDKVLSNESANLEINNLSFYPNPATETVNFNTNLTDVEVYNAQGAIIETISSANALNVSSYEAGVYFIKATEGTSRVVVK